MSTTAADYCHRHNGLLPCRECGQGMRAMVRQIADRTSGEREFSMLLTAEESSLIHLIRRAAKLKDQHLALKLAHHPGKSEVGQELLRYNNLVASICRRLIQGRDIRDEISDAMDGWLPEDATT